MREDHRSSSRFWQNRAAPSRALNTWIGKRLLAFAPFLPESLIRLGFLAGYGKHA